MADFPPSFWIEPEQTQHYICGTPRAVEQALQAGVPARHVHATSGMIIRPDFYRATITERAQEQAQLGLDPTRPVGLVMFGGHGSKAMLGIAAQLKDTQLILICGHNEALAGKLRKKVSAAKHVVLGFTPDVARYMQLADFMIGKPGPGSLSEAVQKRLPVIVVRNAWTMPQERYNTQWVRENNVGLVHTSFRTMQAAVEEMKLRLDEFRTSLARIDNRAVFEIPDILQQILDAPLEDPSGSADALWRHVDQT
jgi:UDP-N-acetylglucosamine:LPS N-acetylglucosamine transferase